MIDDEFRIYTTKNRLKMHNIAKLIFLMTI